MPHDIKETLQIEALPTLVETPTLAVGMKISKLQYLSQVMGDENAPHFLRNQEPTQDGKAFQATNGRHYYRPQLRVAQRSVSPAGPDVRFLKDAQGKVRLQFELEESPLVGLPAEAEPFNVRVNQILLRWVEGGQSRQRLFDQPTLGVDGDQQGADKPHFFIQVGTTLANEEVEPIYRALKDTNAQAKLEVTLVYGFWIDDPAPPEPRPRPPKHPPIFVEPNPDIFVRPDVLEARPVQFNNVILTRSRSVPANIEVRIRPEEMAALRRPQLTEIQAVALTNTNFSPGVIELFREQAATGIVLEQAKEREQQPNFQNVSLTRSFPFNFDPTLEQNRLIYSALESTASLSESWTDTDFGPIRKAPFPNTVYRLPDEIRLTYNADLGAPHMLPTLYRDVQEEIRVRVTLRAVPWHDPDKLVRLRDYLHRSSGGALAAPVVVVGGYKEAKFRLTSIFPEEIQALSEESSISLEGGFDLTLDLSLEFYKFLGDLMTGPVGLTGEVTVTLDTSAATPETQPQERVRRVPMRLNLDDLATLPVMVKIEGELVSPRQIQIVNRARAEMRIGNCIPRLLQYDDNSVVPIGVFEAMSTTLFPTNLAADASIPVEIKPKDENQNLLWNAVQIELIGQELVQPAKQILDRIHELAPSGTLKWQITVECPLFLQDPVPAQYQTLYRVEVQISRTNYAAQQVVLGKGQATGRVTMQRTLQEITGEDAASLPTFNYRVRNIYFDHEGQWGPEKSGEGSNLFVFPNPVQND